MKNRNTALSDEPTSSALFPPLYNLVYCSRATPGTNEASVARILATAQRWNPVYGITGLLVFGGGIFFQWLEGPHASVDALMTKLRADPRHEAIVLLSETEEVRERLFPDWAMERVTANDIREVLLDAKNSASDPQNAAALERLLVQLKSNELQELGAA
jgi:hypothetical protein